MIDTIRKVRHELSRTWDNLADGWRELCHHSRNAITRFTPGAGHDANDAPPTSPAWAILAGEIADAGQDLVVRLEMPGIDRDDCEVILSRDRLQIRGEKRADRELIDADYYVRERAYGRFTRDIALPVPVDMDHADASFRNGVLTVKARKLDVGTRHRLKVA